MDQARPEPESTTAAFRAQRVDRIVAVYLVTAAIWIAVSGPLASWVADRSTIPLVALETGKGLAFVVVTALALRVALRQWARRIERAALREREAADRLRQADDLRSAFLNSVSHELRTPLTSIVGYGDTIRKLADERGDDEIAPLAERLVANAQRLESLVLDLLDTDALLRGVGAPRLRRTDMAELVPRVVEAVEVGERTVEIVGESVDADVDVPKFERVIQLLLDNAIKHTPTTARVAVRWGVVDDELILTVEDDGPGLPRDVLDGRFMPFVQGRDAIHAPSPGIGLGLALAHQYVRLHRGRLDAHNTTAGGARMQVRIPRVQDA